MFPDKALDRGNVYKYRLWECTWYLSIIGNYSGETWSQTNQSDRKRQLREREVAENLSKYCELILIRDKLNEERHRHRMKRREGAFRSWYNTNQTPNSDCTISLTPLTDFASLRSNWRGAARSNTRNREVPIRQSWLRFHLDWKSHWKAAAAASAQNHSDREPGLLIWRLWKITIQVTKQNCGIKVPKTGNFRETIIRKEDLQIDCRSYDHHWIATVITTESVSMTYTCAYRYTWNREIVFNSQKLVKRRPKLWTCSWIYFFNQKLSKF